MDIPQRCVADATLDPRCILNNFVFTRRFTRYKPFYVKSQLFLFNAVGGVSNGVSYICSTKTRIHGL